MSVINQLNATSEYYWLNKGDPVDILNTASALLWKLMGKAIEKDNWEVKPHETVDGGLMIKVPIEYAASHSGAYGATSVIDQSKKNIIDAARFRWAGVWSSNTLNLDDLTQNTGDEAIISLTKQYMESIKKEARVKMAADVISAAATSHSINGLGDLFNATQGTAYGSLTETEMSAWKANVLTAKEEISFEVMQKIFRQPDMGGFRGMLPNFCCTTQTLLDGFERSLMPQQRFYNEDMLDAGWAHVTHKGAPIVADKGYAGGVLDAINLDFLSLRSHKDYNFTTPVWNKKTILGQPDVITSDTRWRGNLLCSSRRMHCRHTNLTEPS